MEHKRLSKALKDRAEFVIVVELVGGPGFNYTPIEKFMKAKAAAEAAGFQTPAGFDFVGLTSPQNPGGAANIEPANVLTFLTTGNILGDLDFIPHVSCKDHNVDGIVSSLAGFRSRGVDSILALTGDKPVKAQGVFEVESVGLLSLVSDMNSEQYIKANPGKLDKVHQFFCGAAVSPFKYTEPSLMQQYYKMEKKIAAGARFLITQVGWDWKKSVELFRYLKDKNLHIPVLGNVYLLSTITPAPRLMHDIKLPGCFVSDALFQKVCNEGVEAHIERAAQQVAMYKAIGAAGVDIGGVHDFEMFRKIVTRAAEIGDGWEAYKDNLCWPADKAFYLYDDNGKAVGLSTPAKKFSQRYFNFMHRAILDPKYPGYSVFKGLCAVTGVGKGKGATYKLFNAAEKGFKYLVFDCEECGDCYLPENFGLCTIGGCEKGLDNAPCGDATVEGRCGNNIERVCIGELVYHAAAAMNGGRDKLTDILKPRIPSLRHTSSLVNYLFGRDHTMKGPLLGIGEAVHAAIPKTAAIMKELHAFGKDAFTTESGPLNYVKALIESQVREGASYIAVNLDAFGKEDPRLPVELMKEYAKLVRVWGRGVPICVDSSNAEVLKAGLKEWYNAPEKVRPPLVHSIRVGMMDEMLPLKKIYDYAFIGLLGTEQYLGSGGSESVEERCAIARTILNKATQYGFKPGDLFFDATVAPLAADLPTEPDVPGKTYRAFETMKKIKSDPRMKGVHCSLSVSNSVRDLPGRKIGVCRAYVAKAVEYGLDAGIVTTAHRYDIGEADPDLLALVDAFATMDGSPGKRTKAVELMDKFRSENRKATA